MDAKKMLLDYLDLTKSNYTEGTQETHCRYTNHLINCFEVLKIKRFEEIDKTIGYKIVDWYKNETVNKNNSINKNLNFLKTVMKHYGVYTEFHKFKSLPKDTKPFKRFYQEELTKIINYVNTMDDSKNSIVYRTFVLLALDSGMRKSELLNIKIRNIDFDKHQIYLEETKTGRHRYAPFGDFSENEIRELIEFKHDREYLMINILKDRRLNKNDIRLFYRRLRRKLGIDRIHTHRFRKTFASTLADNGMPLQYIQVLLDHRSLKTTMKYIQFDSITPFKEYHQFNDWHIKKKKGN